MEILQKIAFVISLVSLGIIAYGALLAILHFIKNELGRISGKFTITEVRVIRLNFGYYLLLGLEFLIASDLIRTIIQPTLEDLAALGGIVAIRTVLTYFLNKEIQQARQAQEIIPDKK